MMAFKAWIETNRVVSLADILFGGCLLVVLACCYLIYSPGLLGPLILDDLWNLEPLGEGGGINTLDNFLRFVFSNDSGPIGRPVSMLSFLIDAQDWPLNVPALKQTNLMLHLLTGLAFCWFVILMGRLTRLSSNQAAVMGLLSVTLWLLHPFNVSTTLYVVQRMTQLMTLFSLAALICYLYGRQLIETSKRKGLMLLCLALFPFGLLAVLSKENGALLLLLIIVIESILQHGARVSYWLRLWYGFGVVLPIVIVVVYLMFDFSGDLQLYDNRDFNLLERLLTESRIIWIYIANILLPNTLGSGVFHDDFLISRSLFAPVTTVIAIVALALLIGSAFYLRKNQPVYSFAVFWFLSAHLLESTYLPLELYFEHRNYLAMMGPLFAVSWYLIHFSGKFAAMQSRGLHMSVAAVLLWCATLTFQQANLWGNSLALHSHWAHEKPESVRAQLAFADILKYLNEPEIAMERLQVAHQHHPRELTVLLYMWNLSCEYGLPAPYSLEQVAEYPNLEYVRDDINHHLKILLENLIQRRCNFPAEAIMVGLFEKIGEFPMPNYRRSGFHFHFSDLFVFYGKLNSALINLSRAFEANPAAQIPIRQALLSASANNFADALVFIERARAADAKRNPLLPSSQVEINQLESDFRQKLAPQ